MAGRGGLRTRCGCQPPGLLCRSQHDQGCADDSKHKHGDQGIYAFATSRHAYGIVADTWFEKKLSFPLESTAVVT